jgi:uncharacterized lipoprotein NlpE involved in copper resistance
MKTKTVILAMLVLLLAGCNNQQIVLTNLREYVYLKV